MPVPENLSKSTQSVTFVTFRLGSQTYALPITHVQQIIEMVTITPLPQVNPVVVGVFNFHGGLVPVVNMRRLLNLADQPPTLHTPIIMVNISSRLIGLIVDEVLNVLQRPAEEVVDPSNILLEEMGQTPLIQGLVREQDGSVLLLNPEQLLKPYSVKVLTQAVDSLAQSLQQNSTEARQAATTLDKPSAETEVKKSGDAPGKLSKKRRHSKSMTKPGIN